MKLLKWFFKEQFGYYKSDLCRYAALYEHGGYYFDNDMLVVEPIPIAPTTEFVSPFEWGYNMKGEPRGKGLFNSFIATAPKHPILHATLFDFVLQYYEQGRKFHTHMGTGALYHAYISLTNEQRGNVDMALEEVQLNEHTHPDFPRLDGVGCCCDMVVQNITEQKVYFYSHMVGAKNSVTCAAKR